MDIDLLRTFLAVVQQRSFVGAALQVSRTQSAVSQQVQRLEALFGGPLLLRSSREVRLTAAGERLVDYARRLVTLSDEARRAVQGLATQRSLRVGVVEDVAAFALAEVLQQLNRLAPDLRLDIVSAMTRELLPHLGYRYDAVIGMARPEQRGGHEVARLPMCWLGEWQAGRVPLAVHGEGCSMRLAATAALDGAGLPWDTVIVAGGISANLAAVEAGLAVTVLADRLAPVGLPRCRGLPALPSISVRLYVHEEADMSAVALLEQALQRALASRASPDTDVPVAALC